MKFRLSRSSSDEINIVEINTLDELIQFAQEQDHALILERNFLYNSDDDELSFLIEDGYCDEKTAAMIKTIPWTIEVYDSWRE